MCSANVMAKNKYAIMAIRAKAPAASIQSEGFFFMRFMPPQSHCRAAAKDPRGGLESNTRSGQPTATDKQFFQRIEQS